MIFLNYIIEEESTQKSVQDSKSFVIAERNVQRTYLIVRARPCFTLWSFSLIRKTELWKTNKPPAVRMVEVASAYSIKPPLLNNVRFANRII